MSAGPTKSCVHKGYSGECRFIDGKGLDASHELLRAAHSVLIHEQVVKDVAAQLLQVGYHDFLLRWQS